MTTRGNVRRSTDPSASVERLGFGGPLPVQVPRRVAASPGDRLVRQVQAIDAWVAGRRQRERVLDRPGLSREERVDVDRQVEILRRTHDTIKGHCARALEAEPRPLRWPEPTAVLAHRHVWFRDAVALSLAERGVTVVASTDNGAEALGAVVAEQPDLLLTGERLVMVPAGVLLDEVGRFAEGTLRAVQVPHPAGAGVHADAVLARHSPPAVAAALVALHQDAVGQARQDDAHRTSRHTAG